MGQVLHGPQPISRPGVPGRVKSPTRIIAADRNRTEGRVSLSSGKSWHALLLNCISQTVLDSPSHGGQTELIAKHHASPVQSE
jgi:hypothetical protein